MHTHQLNKLQYLIIMRDGDNNFAPKLCWPGTEWPTHDTCCNAVTLFLHGRHFWLQL